MKKYNETTYAILGILTTDCKTGYAIKQLIDQSLNHFWKISYGQIYPTLKMLQEEELATIQVLEEDGKPSRKEYHLTLKGEQILKEWLEKPLRQIPSERNEVLLKLFFGRHQSKEKNIAFLQDYQQKLEQLLQTYLGIEAVISQHGSKSGDGMYWRFTLDYGIRTTKAAVEWCQATIYHLEEE